VSVGDGSGGVAVERVMEALTVVGVACAEAYPVNVAVVGVAVGLSEGVAVVERSRR
jgi:hypothetical protein